MSESVTMWGVYPANESRAMGPCGEYTTQADAMTAAKEYERLSDSNWEVLELQVYRGGAMDGLRVVLDHRCDEGMIALIGGRVPVVASSFSWNVFFAQTCPASVRLYQELTSSHGDRLIMDILPVCFGVGSLDDITPKKLLSWLKQMRIPADSPSYKYVERYAK